MGLRYDRALSASGKPNCYESSEVRLVDGVRDIPFEGALIAVIVPTRGGQGCQHLGLIFDDQSTLVVDCLHGEAEVRAFRAACRDNQIERVTELSASIMAPCPPPTNQLQIEDWRQKLFRELRPER